MNIRQQTEEIERKTLSPYATLSSETKGRQKPKEPCELRTEFQRDRDRIIHSKAFRRLKHKTQVFITPEGDHYRTRLTHTLEVSQIARSIARALRLNEDLTEAMALGHDLGHTPFGHAGERALNRVCPSGFSHNEQSLRCVDVLEGGGGINLTFEVRDGILNHTWKSKPATPEGQVLQYADRIAYINHDIDDALRGGVISRGDLPKDAVALLGATHGGRIDAMVRDIAEQSAGKPEVTMSREVLDAMLCLRSYMFDNVYNIGSAAKTEEGKAETIIEAMYHYFSENPREIPDFDISLKNGFTKEEQIIDYIAGMTDRYAIRTYSKLFLPEGWYNSAGDIPSSKR